MLTGKSRFGRAGCCTREAGMAGVDRNVYSEVITPRKGTMKLKEALF